MAATAHDENNLRVILNGFLPGTVFILAVYAQEDRLTGLQPFAAAATLAGLGFLLLAAILLGKLASQRGRGVRATFVVIGILGMAFGLSNLIVSRIGFLFGISIILSLIGAALLLFWVIPAERQARLGESER